MTAGRVLQIDSCWASEVNALVQGALQRFTQWIERPTCQL